MKISGKNYIGGEPSAEGKTYFQALNPRTGEKLDPPVHEAVEDEINRAMTIARESFITILEIEPGQRAAFLDELARQLTDMKETIINRADLETALGIPRLEGEMTRTVNQIRMFAEPVRTGSYLEVIIDTADPSREPVPKPDIRQTQIPVGPVVVFSASNFPLAFSVAGGDTVSALAAGNPVIVKAHPNHPGTSELVSMAVLNALEKTGLPHGLFALIQGESHEVGTKLVTHPNTKAVAFTGSLSGGRALYEAAASRPEPIPVYAEMGSINPVIVLPHAVRKRGEMLAERLSQSITLGAGQFCTNPGLILGIGDDGFNNWVARLSDSIKKHPPQTMLNRRIRDAYLQGIQDLLAIDGVESITGNDPGETYPQLLTADSETFIRNPKLRDEVFGPSSLIINCPAEKDLVDAADVLSGQLTITLHAEKNDGDMVNRLISIIRLKAGRLLWGGAPTGVEVCPAMFHGGPYPATTDSRTTSVGTSSMKRFMRPVSFQNYPEELLPAELQNRNKRRLWRRINNKLTKENI